MQNLIIHPPLTPLSLTSELLQCAFTTANSMQKKQQCIDIAKICHELALEILNKTYKPSLYTRFAVTDPKLRDIYAPALALLPTVCPMAGGSYWWIDSY